MVRNCVKAIAFPTRQRRERAGAKWVLLSIRRISTRLPSAFIESGEPLARSFRSKRHSYVQLALQFRAYPPDLENDPRSGRRGYFKTLGNV